MSIELLDEGATKARNRSTFLHQAEFFSSYCLNLGIKNPSLEALPVVHRERVLAAFALDVASGSNLSGRPVRAKSVKNYLLAASSFSTDARLLDPRFRYDAHGHKIGQAFFPLLSKLLTHIKKWQPGKNDALPITMPILRSLIKTAQDSTSTLSLASCTADAVILGLYTGSRCSEYCKGSPIDPSDLFSKVPSTQFTGPFAGFPIALTVADFEFLTANKTFVPWTQAASTATYVRVRFRFDKGGTGNFSVRTFRQLPKSSAQFCPVNTAIRILTRWSSISSDHIAPVFCFQQAQATAYLPDHLVTKALRTATSDAYADPKHLYRIHISRVRTHSIRVTACFILVAANLPDHVIEHRLRWASTAWKVYLRESFDTIDKASLAVFSATVASDTDTTDTTQHHTFDGDDIL